MVSEVGLCNRALAEIGTQSTISSIQSSDGSNEANACALLYYPCRDSLLRAAHWDFARAQLALTQLKSSDDTNSTCPVPWGYEYAYPSNCMKMRYMLPYLNTSNTASPPLTTAQGLGMPAGDNFGRPIRFLVATDLDANNNDSTVILTNQPQAIGVYTKQIVNPDLFDPQFQDALVAYLASKLVPALSLNLALMKIQIAVAKELIDAARVTNGNEGPQILNMTPDWLEARGVGYPSGPGYCWLGWENIAWPSGF